MTEKISYCSVCEQPLPIEIWKKKAREESMILSWSRSLKKSDLKYLFNLIGRTPALHKVSVFEFYCILEKSIKRRFK